MTDWPIRSLGEVCDFVRGVTYDKANARSEMKSGFIPLLRATNITEKGLLREDFVFVPSDGVRADQKLMSGDALITIASGSASVVGRSVLVEDPGEMTFGAFCGVLRPRPEILPRYLSHFMSSRSVRAAWSEAAQGTNINNLKRDDILQTECLLPPLEEQMRIVELLDAVTARVTELTACYEQARTHANDLFTSALRDALEGDQSAPLRTLDDLCEEGIVKLGRGNIISKKDIAAKPGSYPIYSSARENEGKFGEYGDYMFDEEMITWSIDGGGRLFYRPKHKFSVTNVGGTLRVLDPGTLDIQYLHRVLQNLHSQRVFDWVAKAHPSVIRKVYDAIPMPPLSEQKRVVARLDSLRAKTSEMVAAYDAKLIAAKNLRQSILESAFAGDL